MGNSFYLFSSSVALFSSAKVFFEDCCTHRRFLNGVCFLGTNMQFSCCWSQSYGLFHMGSFLAFISFFFLHFVVIQDRPAFIFCILDRCSISHRECITVSILQYTEHTVTIFSLYFQKSTLGFPQSHSNLIFSPGLLSYRCVPL